MQISIELQVIFCTILSPSIFNVAPLIMILTVNTLLVLEVLKYYRIQNKENNNWLFERTIELKDFNSTNQSIIVRQVNEVVKKLTRSQKSHHTVIIATDIWSVLTSFPYYILNSYFILFQLIFFQY
jgi:hypothetical protein